MIARLHGALVVLQKGHVVANPATWKNRQIAVTAVSALIAALVALAEAFGYGIPIDRESLDGLAAGLVTVVLLFNAWGTAATSEKVGLPGGEREADSEPVAPEPAERRIGYHPHAGYDINN
jgi:hypothetical protein